MRGTYSLIEYKGLENQLKPLGFAGVRLELGCPGAHEGLGLKLVINKSPTLACKNRNH